MEGGGKGRRGGENGREGRVVICLRGELEGPPAGCWGYDIHSVAMPEQTCNNSQNTSIPPGVLSF